MVMPLLHFLQLEHGLPAADLTQPLASAVAEEEEDVEEEVVSDY